MSALSTVILGTGSYAPERVMTNAELALMVDTSDEWIVSRSGIRERRIAAPTETSSDMAEHAARAALQDARIAASEIDLLICATFTPDTPLPAAACLIQNKLGVPSTAACFDLNAACSGFIYALDTACAMISSGRYKKALVVGVEKMSPIIDWTDRTTCVLFGDGAGAAVVGTSIKTGIGLIGTRLGALGEHAELLNIPAATANGANGNGLADGHAPNGTGGPYIRMKGKEVFKIAVRGMEDAAREILEQHGLAADTISLVIPHQANLRIIEAIAQYLELPMERFFVNVDRYGNTSAASIPIALDEARKRGRIQPGDLTLLVAFGAGLTYGSALIRW